MKNKLIALLALIIAAGAGYYFLIVKKGSTDPKVSDKVSDAALAALTPSSVAVLKDDEIAAITPDQKTKMSSLVLAAISKREDAINLAKEQANQNALALSYTSVVDLETALSTAKTQGNTALIGPLTAKLTAARTKLANDEAAAKLINDRKIKMSNVTIAQIKAFSRYELDTNFTAEELSYFNALQNQAMVDRRKVLDQQDADAILQSKADALSVISISKFTQEQLTAANDAPEAKFYSDGQKSAIANRQKTLTEIEARKAMEAKFSKYTPADIDKMTLKQLQAFTDKELEILAAVAESAYNEYRADKAKLEQAAEYDKQAADFKVALTKITQDEKDMLADLARDIYDDCIGWNGHTYWYYEKLWNFPDYLFYYFIHYTWNQYDGWQLLTRMNAQSYDVVSKTNRRLEHTGAMNVAITEKIKERIKSFPYVP